MSGIWKIEHDGNDITAALAPYFLSLSLSDQRGIISDDFSFVLEDTNGEVSLPAIGSQIRVWIGDQDIGLIFKGVFIIDEISSNGPPDVIEVKTNAVDFTEGLKVRKETFYENTTIGEIVAHIAGQYDLSFNVHADLASIPIHHKTQNNEHDLNFLTRLARDFGASFTIKNQILIFSKEATGETATGQIIPVLSLDRKETTSHRHSEKARRHKYTGAKAAWNDIENGGKVWEIVGNEDNVKALSPTFASAAFAQEAAAAEYDRLQRGEVSISITLPRGRPALIPETPVRLSGFKAVINSAQWFVTSVTHTISDRGLHTDFDMETQISD